MLSLHLVRFNVVGCANLFWTRLPRRPDEMSAALSLAETQPKTDLDPMNANNAITMLQLDARFAR